jgi:hypothetical protein
MKRIISDWIEFKHITRSGKTTILSLRPFEQTRLFYYELKRKRHKIIHIRYYNANDKFIEVKTG